MKLMTILLCAMMFNSCGSRPEDDLIKGDTGKDGSSCSVAQTSYGAEITCTDGTGATLYNGDDGNDGSNGQGCTIQDAVDGAIVTCGDDAVVIYDGVDGNDGQDGENFTTSDQVTEFVDPCGDYPGHLDEILMVTYGGDVVAYFESGGKRFLAVLAPGSYKTTDKQQCSFTISNSGQISF